VFEHIHLTKVKNNVCLKVLCFKKIIFDVLISIMKILLPACFILLSLVACNPSTQENSPKLVVGIVVDLMKFLSLAI